MAPRSLPSAHLLPAALACLFGCRAAEPADVEPAVSWPLLSCDSIAPSVCGFPWPNNVFTVDDPTTATGRRLALSDELVPKRTDGTPIDPARWNAFDGFSPGGSILVHLPGAVDTGLATADRIERSIEPDSPTVLLDTVTGERILHIAETDHSTDDLDRRTLLLTPARTLEPGRRYIVAVRNLVDASGEPIDPSPAFAALRDGTALADDPSVEARRPLYADIFARLAEAGIPRDDLIVAWDFTTASDEALTAAAVRMRDATLAAGPFSYTIDTVDPDFDPAHIAYRIEGTMTVPLYLSQPDWPGTLVLGDDGLPVAASTYEIPFEVLIPNSALDEPKPLLQYGHGLLGKHTQIESAHFRPFIDDYGYVLFAVDWVGMAEEDQLFIAAALSEGRVDDLGVMMDRLHQAMSNQVAAMRMMATSFANDPMFGGFIDPDRRTYWGISQGGILGSVYMALSTDIERGCLEVMGQPYHLLLLRSVDFEPFFDIVRGAFPDPRDVQLVLAFVQQLWDRVEPTGYARHLVSDPLPDTPAHRILFRAARGDHQVPPLGAHVMARTAGVPQLDTGLGQTVGLPLVAGPIDGSAYAEFDFGLPPAPVCNVPQALCEDPHGKLRGLDEARAQLDRFFRDGVVIEPCGGPCVFPDLSGCAGGEDNDGVCSP